MYKLKRMIKKYWVLFCTFFVINIFFIGVIVNVLNVEEQLKTQQSLISEDAKTMFFQRADGINKDELIDLLKDKRVILEGIITLNNDEEMTEIKGTYYNYEIEKKYPLMEGRMFTAEEIKSKKKAALVGYNLKDRIINNTIKIQGEAYEVVGILGDKKSNVLRDSIYINLNSMDFTLSMKAITVDTLDEKASDAAMNISQSFNKSKRAEVYISEPYGKHNPLKEAIGDNKLHLISAF
ncbi:ABC transporter permease [Clostridium polynesiense]|uniref:ABC transporter permease n=1 Tax=Clostridium polynesiense TaxID=1325933 RepID=UPI0005900B00|nr:ABC transporter permease [Clostridium polynesiense]